MGESLDDLESKASSDMEEKTLAVRPGQPPAGLDWEGNKDPDDPQNWSLFKRIYHCAAIALLCLATTFGASVYTPGVPGVMEEFKVSSTAATLGLTVYTFAQGLGPILAAPISETYGRNIIYRVTLPLSMCFTIGAGFSQTFAQLLVCRFFAGAFGGPALAVGGGSNTDLWPTQHRAVASSLYLIAPFLGPALGPPAGGFSVMRFSWRWTQWDMLWMSIPFYLFSIPLQETYKKIILERRAARLNKMPAQPRPSKSEQAKVMLTMNLLRPLKMMIFEPIVTFISLYNAYAFAVLFSFFGAYPIVFTGVYNFNPGESGLTFLAVGLGVCTGSLICILTDKIMYQKQHKKAISAGLTRADPEHRLYAAMVGSFGIPLGIFWFAWTARSSVHWISPVLAGIPFGMGVISVFQSTALYTFDVYGPQNGASALAANGFVRYTFGAVFPLFTRQTYNTLGIAWATSLYGFLSLAMLPIPWILFKWGPLIRAKSKLT